MSLDVFDMAESLFSDYYGEDVYITQIINDFYEFKNDSRTIFKYLKANHIDLDFNGYERTLSDLKKLNITNIEEVFISCRDFLEWDNYFFDCQSLIEYYIEVLNLKIDYLNAFIDPDRVNKKLNLQIKKVEEERQKMLNYEKSVKRHRRLIHKLSSNLKYRYKEMCMESSRSE